MVRGEAVVDYENFRCARVAIFIDATEPARTLQLLKEHSEAINRITSYNVCYTKLLRL